MEKGTEPMDIAEAFWDVFERAKQNAMDQLDHPDHHK